MLRVKRAVLHIGLEKFEAGVMLPDHIAEVYGKDLEAAGLVESDAPKRQSAKLAPVAEDEGDGK